MNKEELKAGERYNFTLLYTGQSINNKFRFESPTGIHYILGLGDMEAFSPVSAPKYDPCRIFQRGDKVRVKREVNGRPVYIGEDAWEPLDPEEIWTVVEEKETGWVKLKYCCVSADVWHGMLDLVTPVEELEPYLFAESENSYDIFRKKNNGHQLRASFWWKHNPTPELLEMTKEEARAATEAECKRLNEEYRKEQE